MSSCPISGESVDENAARVVGALVVWTSVLYLWTAWGGWVWLLVFDFLTRLHRCNWSPFGWIAQSIRRRFLIPRWIDAAPKRFAAKIGGGMAGVGLILHLLGWVGLAQGVITLLMLAALMESAAGFCVGCWMYGMVMRVRG